MGPLRALPPDLGLGRTQRSGGLDTVQENSDLCQAGGQPGKCGALVITVLPRWHPPGSCAVGG